MMNSKKIQLINLLGNIVEAKSFEDGQHIKRVQEYVRILADYICNHFPEYGLTDELVEIISIVSPLHDIGKIKIPDSILLKPEKLTDEEFEEMKKHTIYGCDFVNTLDKLFDKKTCTIALEVVRSHHEKYDGKGYPDGLVGEAIPISAQIVSIADCFDALTSKRVYKDAFSTEVSKQMILDGKCGKFSDNLITAFLQCYDQLQQYHDILETTKDLTDDIV